MVFHLGPLAPSPPLGHVDTEDADGVPIPAEAVHAGAAEQSGLRS
jgi:putative monooxygenase